MTRTRLLALAIISLAACGGAQKTAPAVPSPLVTPPSKAADAAPMELAFPDEPFRAQAPAPSDVRPFSNPVIQQFTLKNGIHVYLVERHQLPVVSMELTFEGGSINDPKGKEGLAATCMSLLSEGTEKLPKIEFREALGDLASTVTSYASMDQQGVAMSTLAEHLDATLDLFGDTLLSPGMRQEELDRMIKSRLAALEQMKGSPAAVAARLAGSIVWGPDHPYGRFHTEASTKAVTLAHCKKYVAAYVRPHGAKLFVFGDVSRAQIEEKVGARLSAFSGKPKRSARAGKAAPRKRAVWFVDKPGAQQSIVSIMHTGPARAAADYFETWIMGTILGGGFSSRINMNIREKNGYAYGARGGFSYNRTGSTFSAGGSIRNDATREAIGEIIKEVASLRDGPPTADEMTREKDGAILGLPAQWATGASILSTFQNLVYYGLPLDYYEKFIPNIQGVTEARVQSAAKKHLRPEKAQILVVGDAATVLPEVKELGKPIVMLDLDGKILPTKK